MTFRALKRLDEKPLCAVLGQFPEHLAACGLVLPDPPKRDSLNYDAIRDACMAGEIPAELGDLLFFVSIRGSRGARNRSSGKRRFGSAG